MLILKSGKIATFYETIKYGSKVVMVQRREGMRKHDPLRARTGKSLTCQ